MVTPRIRDKFYLKYVFSSFQIGEEMSQNSFIKQYLAKQQELLRQRMEREAREAAEADGNSYKFNDIEIKLSTPQGLEALFVQPQVLTLELLISNCREKYWSADFFLL